MQGLCPLNEVDRMKMPMDLTEVKLRRKDVFEGKIMTVHVDDVRLPNGEEATREVVDHAVSYTHLDVYKRQEVQEEM